MLNWAVAMIPGGLDDISATRAHRDRMLADVAVKRARRAEGLMIGEAAETPA